MSERSIRDFEETLFKNECINLIESDDNMHQLCGITEYKDDIIRFHIFGYLYKHKLIEKILIIKLNLLKKLMVL